MRQRRRAYGLYQVLTLLAVKSLHRDATPVNIRELHRKHLTSPVHPLAVYPTLNTLLRHHYVVRKSGVFFFEALGFEKQAWSYTLTKAGDAFVSDYFEEVDIMRRLPALRLLKRHA